MIRKVLLLIVCLLLFPAYAFAETLDNGLVIDTTDWQPSLLEDAEAQLIYHADRGELELGIYTKRDLTSNRTHSWRDLSEEDLRTLADEIMRSQESTLTQLEDWSTFRSQQMQFLKFFGTVTNESGESKNFIQYLTIENGGTLQFSFYKSAAFSPQDIAVADAFVESAYFEELSDPSIDTNMILKLSGIALVIILLVASVIWNIRRYRKKLQKK